MVIGICYIYSILRESGLGKDKHGFKIGEIIFNNLCYADDIPLQVLIINVKEHSEEMGLKSNIKKTKLMTTTKTNRLRIGSEDIKVVDGFCLFGSTINSKGTNS